MRRYSVPISFVGGWPVHHTATGNDVVLVFLAHKFVADVKTEWHLLNMIGGCLNNCKIFRLL